MKWQEGAVIYISIRESYISIIIAQENIRKYSIGYTC
jgi:hypothetical protein